MIHQLIVNYYLKHCVLGSLELIPFNGLIALHTQVSKCFKNVFVHENRAENTSTLGRNRELIAGESPKTYRFYTCRKKVISTKNGLVQLKRHKG